MTRCCPNIDHRGLDIGICHSYIHIRTRTQRIHELFRFTHGRHRRGRGGWCGWSGTHLCLTLVLYTSPVPETATTPGGKNAYQRSTSDTVRSYPIRRPTKRVGRSKCVGVGQSQSTGPRITRKPKVLMTTCIFISLPSTMFPLQEQPAILSLNTLFFSIGWESKLREIVRQIVHNTKEWVKQHPCMYLWSVKKKAKVLCQSRGGRSP